MGEVTPLLRVAELAELLADNTSALQRAVSGAELVVAASLMNQRLELLQQLVSLSLPVASPQDLVPQAELTSALLRLVEHYLPLEQSLQAELQRQQQQVAHQLATLQQGSRAGKAYQRHARH